MMRRDRPLWQAAHRPLFFCAGLAALFSPAVWLWPGGLGADPLRWHLHELLFGMGGAAVGGYLLTALPNWTGAGRVSPQSVRALTLLWLLARLALPLAESLPFWPVLIHAESQNSTFAAILVALIISGLTVWGIGLMNNADYTSAAMAGGLLFLFSLFVIFSLGKD